VRGGYVIYTYIAAGLFGVALAALGVWQVQDWRFNARIAQMEQAHTMSLKAATDAALTQQQAALAKLQELNTAKQKVEQNYALEKRNAAVAALSARAELDGLRQELYALPSTSPIFPTAPSTNGVNATAPERKLLEECATALVEVAAGADILATQLVGLQSYVRNVCSAPAR